jgi:stearoyl-CoA desaturase (delta-9 desaturase)
MNKNEVQPSDYGDSDQIHWVNTVFLLLTPVLAAVTVPWYIVQHGVFWQDLLFAATLWITTGLGITVGYHRLLTHRGFSAPAPIRLVAILLGGAAWQNSAISWCSDHRYHHLHVDSNADPYNPKRGFWYSHIGWILVKGRRDRAFKNVPDLWKDPVVRWQHEHYFAASIALNIGVPLAWGLFTGRVGGALIFGALLRVVLVHHFTFAINSFAHIIGTQPWSKTTSARDNWFLSLFTFGEGYHNFHHAFQYDYRNGPAWYNVDPSKWTIWCLAQLKLAKNLKRAPDDVLLRTRFEMQRSRFAQKVESALGETAWNTWLREKEAFAQAARLQHAAWAATADEFKLALQLQVLEAERSVEETLDELEARRQAWVLAKRRKWANQSGDLKREIREIKFALRQAKRDAKAALRDFKYLSDQYTLVMA